MGGLHPPSARPLPGLWPSPGQPGPALHRASFLLRPGAVPAANASRAPWQALLLSTRVSERRDLLPGPASAPTREPRDTGRLLFTGAAQLPAAAAHSPVSCALLLLVLRVLPASPVQGRSQRHPPQLGSFPRTGTSGIVLQDGHLPSPAWPLVPLRHLTQPRLRGPISASPLLLLDASGCFSSALLLWACAGLSVVLCPHVLRVSWPLDIDDFQIPVCSPDVDGNYSEQG